MIFSEIYSAYYNSVASIISLIIDGERSEKELQKAVLECAFGESLLTIIPSLKNGKWQLVHSDMTTSLKHKPTMPLTTLQKRWLKAISLDLRVQLFDVEFPNLEGIEPLFTSEDYCIYDKYSDGDPFEDKEYIRQFRVILEAIRKGTQIKFEMTNKKGKAMFVRCRPQRLEYSEKDDKFRVVTTGWRSVSVVNLSKIRSCVHYIGDMEPGTEEHNVQSDVATFRVVDKRNALERVMLHFAHFEKQAEKLDDGTYLVKIRYDRNDETEMIIRILSFGPMVEVLGSETVKSAVIERLKKQKLCGQNREFL
ncbi:MAG: WYL domain-containing protein [Ruminococcaceae bacterium]|nr:WYL domain-containing protein [Oscillospiraceae bacterium]